MSLLLDVTINVNDGLTSGDIIIDRQYTPDLSELVRYFFVWDKRSFMGDIFVQTTKACKYI